MITIEEVEELRIAAIECAGMLDVWCKTFPKIVSVVLSNPGEISDPSSEAARSYFSIGNKTIFLTEECVTLYQSANNGELSCLIDIEAGKQGVFKDGVFSLQNHIAFTSYHELAFGMLMVPIVAWKEARGRPRVLLDELENLRESLGTVLGDLTGCINWEAAAVKRALLSSRDSAQGVANDLTADPPVTQNLAGKANEVLNGYRPVGNTAAIKFERPVKLTAEDDFKLTDRQMRILIEMANKPNDRWTRAQICDAGGCKDRTATNELKLLVDRGLVVPPNTGKRDGWAISDAGMRVVGEKI